MSAPAIGPQSLTNMASSLIQWTRRAQDARCANANNCSYYPVPPSRYGPRPLSHRLTCATALLTAMRRVDTVAITTLLAGPLTTNVDHN